MIHNHEDFVPKPRRKEGYNKNGKSGNNRPMRNSRDNAAAPAEKRNKQQVVYGLRPLLEALESDIKIDRVYMQSGIESPLMSELKEKLSSCSIPIQYVPVEKLNKFTTANHQGVVATVALVEYTTLMQLLPSLLEQEEAPFLLMLDRLTDVRNVGAIARTAECVGAHAIIVPDHGSAQLNEDAVKTSSGALLRIPICREANLKTAINLAKQSDIQIVAASEKGAVDYLDVDFRRPTLLIMGAEDTGISPELLKLCDCSAKLPIRGNIQSLNVSVAAAVFLYEMLRQRNAM